MDRSFALFGLIVCARLEIDRQPSSMTRIFNQITGLLINLNNDELFERRMATINRLIECVACERIYSDLS